MSALFFYGRTQMDSTDPRSPTSMPVSEAARIHTLVRQGKYAETLAAGEALLVIGHALGHAVEPLGRGQLFGLATAPQGLYFVDDATNTLNLLMQ